jgi:hypothetical protein
MNSPDHDAPLEIRRMLERYCGKNPFGKCFWRLCLAQHVTVKRGGEFHALEGGHKTIFAQGPSFKVYDGRAGRWRVLPGKMYAKRVADRVTTGVLEVPKYPHRGWIMERWFPAHIFGTRQAWEAQKSANGEPMMGPFPTQGGYFMINGPFDRMPQWGDMECAIAQFEKCDRERPVDLEAHYKQLVKDEEDDRERRRQAFEDQLEQIRKSELLPMLKSGSLSAQAFRQQLNALIGDRSHLAII